MSNNIIIETIIRTINYTIDKNENDKSSKFILSQSLSMLDKLVSCNENITNIVEHVKIEKEYMSDNNCKIEVLKESQNKIRGDNKNEQTIITQKFKPVKSNMQDHEEGNEDCIFTRKTPHKRR